MKRTHGLSQREEEVVELLLQGKSNKQIAAALHIAERTVEFHLKNIYAKFKVSSRVELILALGKSTGDFSEKPVESTVAGEGDEEFNGKQSESESRWEQFTKWIAPAGKKEFAMLARYRPILIVVTALMGIALIVGGILTGKNGAVVVGICAAAIAVRQLIVSRKQPEKEDK
jgi:DNA-binding CsgD family transcriptional regulator